MNRIAFTLSLSSLLIVAGASSAQTSPCKRGEVLDAKRATCYYFEVRRPAKGEQAAAACEKRGMKLVQQLNLPDKKLVPKAARGKTFLVHGIGGRSFKVVDDVGNNSFPAAKEDNKRANPYMCQRVAAGECKRGELKDGKANCFYAVPMPMTPEQLQKICKMRGSHMANETELSVSLRANLTAAMKLGPQLKGKLLISPRGIDKKTKKTRWGYFKLEKNKLVEQKVKPGTKAQALCLAKTTWRE